MTTESHVQAASRLRYAALGFRLGRNNSGVLYDERGRPVRFGLWNESKALNDRLKTSDLIGWRPLLVTPDMVGTCVAQFAAIECKPPGWHLTPGDKRGQAQKRFIDMVVADGGYGEFTSAL